MRRIFLFDFDGTITSKDSFILFTYFSVDFSKFLEYWVHAIYFLTFKTKTKSEVKEFFFIKYFENFKEEDFNKICHEFILKYFKKIVKQSFLDYILKLHDNDRVVVVSASIKYYLEPWCKEMNFELLCTELETMDSKITGRFSTPNCNYNQKVERINDLVNLEEFSKVYVFGNSEGDYDMMSLGTKSFYKYFK